MFKKVVACSEMSRIEAAAIKKIPLALTFNAGSSSVKMALIYEGGNTLISFNCQNLGTEKGVVNIKENGSKEVVKVGKMDHSRAIVEVLKIIRRKYPGLEINAVGHRQCLMVELTTADYEGLVFTIRTGI